MKREVVIDPAVQAARSQKLKMVTTIEDKGTFVLVRPANVEELAAHLANKERRAPVSETGAPMAGEESASRRLLLKLGYEINGQATVPVVLGDETLFVRRLDPAGLQQFAAWTMRTDGAILNVMELDSITAFNAAALFCGVASDADGRHSYFTYPEAFEFARARKEDGSAPQEILQLIGAVIEANPSLRPVRREPSEQEKKSTGSASRRQRRSTGKAPG